MIRPAQQSAASRDADSERNKGMMPDIMAALGCSAGMEHIRRLTEPVMKAKNEKIYPGVEESRSFISPAFEKMFLRADSASASPYTMYETASGMKKYIIRKNITALMTPVPLLLSMDIKDMAAASNTPKPPGTLLMILSISEAR